MQKAPAFLLGLSVCVCMEAIRFVVCGLDKPGDDLLSRALRQSTIGAEGLNDRVRNGIGWGPLAITTRLMQATSVISYKLNSKDIVWPCARASDW